ncbi:MAG: ABC transporter permease [Christensenellales bacterium]
MAGYLCALLIGFVLGAITARSKPLDALLSPAARVIRATPVASFIILLFVFLSKERIPAITSFLMVLPVVWSNVYEGINSTDTKLLEMAKVFRLSPAKTLRKIYLPSVFPFLLAAAKTGMGLAWKAGIAAEVMVSPASGIGAELYNAKIYLESADLFAWTAVIVIISMILEKLLVRLVRRLHDTP